MKAAFIEKYGGNEVVCVGEQPEPGIGDEDLLVAVKAASVNPIDFKTRSGALRRILRYRFPLTLGSDLSGVVERTGRAVTRFKPGDAVYARLDKRRIGAFAEFAAVRERDAALKPANLTHVESASIPLVALTSWQALFDVAGLRRGQQLLIHAGSGGIGTFAIQLANHYGAVVATTVGARNAELVRRLGASVVIDYRAERFEERLSDVDVVFDTIAGDTQQRSFGVLKRGGVLVTIAGLPTATVGREYGLPAPMQWGLAWMNRNSTRLARRAGVRFEYLFMRPDGAQLSNITPLLESGAIRPIVDSVYPLVRTSDALAHCEAGHAVGKVVIES